MVDVGLAHVLDFDSDLESFLSIFKFKIARISKFSGVGGCLNSMSAFKPYIVHTAAYATIHRGVGSGRRQGQAQAPVLPGKRYSKTTNPCGWLAIIYLWCPCRLVFPPSTADCCTSPYSQYSYFLSALNKDDCSNVSRFQLVPGSSCVE